VDSESTADCHILGKFSRFLLVERTQFLLQSIVVCRMGDLKFARRSPVYPQISITLQRKLVYALDKIEEMMVLTIAAPKPFFKPPES
jgi:hypothetical protein